MKKIINIFCVDIFIIFNLIEMFVHFILNIKNFNNIRLLKNVRNIFVQILLSKINSYTIINFKYVTKINHQSVTL